MRKISAEKAIEVFPEKIESKIQVDDRYTKSLNSIKSPEDLHVFLYENMMNSWLEYRGLDEDELEEDKK